jgi:conjugative transfer signal peptidase TraF
MLGLAAGAAFVALAPLALRPAPLLLWNASASSPIGLYRIGSAHGLDKGDMAVAWPPADARTLGAERHYLPRNVPLVKPVAAAAGDTVCASGAAVFVNGRQVAARRKADLSGRRLPWWNGCARLRGGEVLLLSSEVPDAFDGRYFGISPREDVVGRARLLWAR